MATYHFTVSVVSRARGHRIVAHAAAQSGTRLRDEYYGGIHNGTRTGSRGSRGLVEIAEIRAPHAAPSWVHDREQLWNRVEAAERRKDAQLARKVEISLPLELDPEQSAALLRAFVDAEFVSQGMIADIAIRRPSADRPGAHVLLSLRALTPAGFGPARFGPKARAWNRKANLIEWRAAWARCANTHLALAGHRVRIDHRTLEDQQIELTAARTTGVSPRWDGERPLPPYIQQRLAEQRDIARQNGEAILADPSLAIRALARQRSVFTREDLVRFLTSRTGDAAQLEAALGSVLGSSELVSVARRDDGAAWTSRDLIEAEKSLMRRAQTMAARRGHGTAGSAAETPPQSSPQGPDAFVHATGEGDFKAIALPQDTKSEILSAMRALWEAHGYRVRTALRAEDQEPLANNDVVVIEGAEMIELKALERLLATAERARAKLVLVADAAQLRALGPLAPMYSLYQAFGSQEPRP